MEKNLSVKNILDCTNGRLVSGNENYICKRFVIDTREINSGDVFIGIKGKNVDGSLLWKKAFELGAGVVIVQDVDFLNEEISAYEGKAIIKVKDSVVALQQMATAKRELYGSTFPVIAVTGSVGKTSTKDIIANVLSQKYKVLKTQGNNNNEIGLPLTLLRLQDHNIAVVEMGMNHFGEISKLSKIAKPTIGVITNIGTSHIGNLGSRENILKAKLEILDGMSNPFLIINNDNDLLHAWYAKNNNVKVKTFGIKNESDIMAKNIDLHENYSNFTCQIKNESFKIKVPIGGEHFVLNSLCAAILGKLLMLDESQIKKGIETFSLTRNRMEIVTLKNGAKVINDSYNASYESMKAAIEYLASMEEARKIAVLGDMLELGDFSEELHRKVGCEVQKNNINILICMGENAKFIAEEAVNKGMPKENVLYEQNLEAVGQRLNNIITSNDAVLIKASNGMKFYKLLDFLQ